MAISLSQISKQKKKRAALITALVLMIFSVPIMFENCSQPASPSTSASSVAASAGFAYNTAFDTLAYMSCSGYVDPAGNYFTFRAGAYGANSGVRTDATWAYDARNLAVNDKINAIQQSSLNNNIYAQMAVRSPSAADPVSGTVYGFQAVFSPPTGTGNNYYVSQLIGALSQNSILNLLFSGATSTDWHNSFTVAGAQQNFAGSIQFTDSEAEAANIRSQVGTSGLGGYLTLNYAPVGSINSAVTPTAGSLTTLYGTGYKFNFALASGHTSGVARTVTAITEYDLTTQTVVSGHTWTCDPSLVFTLVNSLSDLGTKIHCTANNSPQTAAQANALANGTLRAMLPASAWNIDYVNRCIYPMGTVVGYCNGSATAVTNYSGGVCDPTQNTCPHYVSICTRN